MMVKLMIMRSGMLKLDGSKKKKKKSVDLVWIWLMMVVMHSKKCFQTDIAIRMKLEHTKGS